MSNGRSQSTHLGEARSRRQSEGAAKAELDEAEPADLSEGVVAACSATRARWRASCDTEVTEGLAARKCFERAPKSLFGEVMRIGRACGA